MRINLYSCHIPALKNPVIISISVIITIFCDGYLNDHVNNKVIIMNSQMCLGVLCSLCQLVQNKKSIHSEILAL